ncbi:MAG: hypothetical protein ACRDOL_28865 [Streptosporangiaceae bacterium]
MKKIGSIAGAAALASALGLGLATAAQAQTSGPVAVPNTVSNGDGSTGFYLAYDAHTHYKQIQETFTATPLRPGQAVVLELSDPQGGPAYSLYMTYTGGKYKVSYGHGRLPYQSGYVANDGIQPLPANGTFVLTHPIVTGHSVTFNLNYNPTSGSMTFTVTTDSESLSHTMEAGTQSFTEAGYGVYAVGASGRLFQVTRFRNVDEEFYSSTIGLSPITVVRGVYGFGGLTQDNYSIGGIVKASPRMSLAGGTQYPVSVDAPATFNVYAGI